MTRRQRRAAMIAAGTGLLGVAVLLVLQGLRDSVVFFHTPAEALTRHIPPGQRIRLGGLVAPGSLRHTGAATVTFAITDKEASIHATYTGILPDLFREGQGVVAEGRLDSAGRFEADTVLAKHDENYMPAEVAKALKEQGVWKGAATAGGARR
jgi:cytochrome c-type biogenesis protein CcmE